jgi:hypothetical protein
MSGGPKCVDTNRCASARAYQHCFAAKHPQALSNASPTSFSHVALIDPGELKSRVDRFMKMASKGQEGKARGIIRHCWCLGHSADSIAEAVAACTVAGAVHLLQSCMNAPPHPPPPYSGKVDYNEFMELLRRSP